MFRHYSRFEQDSLIYDNYFNEDNYDGQTGTHWFWKFIAPNEDLRLEGEDLGLGDQRSKGTRGGVLQIDFLPQRSIRLDGTVVSRLALEERMKYIEPQISHGGKKLKGFPSTKVFWEGFNSHC